MNRAAVTIGTAFLVMGVALIVVAQVDSPSNGPTQVHVTHMGDRLGILWARPYEGDNLSGPPVSSSDIVRFGVDSSPVQTVAPVRVYVVAPGTIIHTAHVPLPQHGSVLRYEVGSDSEGWSATYEVPLGPDAGVWRFVGYGDHGAPSRQDTPVRGKLVEHLTDVRAVAALHTGDVSYANGRPEVWDEYFEHVEPVAAKIPLIVAAGNHELEGDWVATGPAPEYEGFARSGMHPYEMFVERFEFPRAELHFSVDVGPVHVLVFNTEDICATQQSPSAEPWNHTPFCRAVDANQTLLDWVEEDLATHAEAPWTFVLIHRPAYSAGAHVGHPVLLERFNPIFEEHGVDLVLAGHDHNYQRSFPMIGDSPGNTNLTDYAIGDGVVHVVSGGAGRTLYGLQEPRPEWTAARAVQFHYLVIDVTPTGLRVETVSLLGGQVIDTFIIGEEPRPTEPAPEDPTTSPAPGILLPAVLAAAFAAVVARRPD